MPEVYLPQVECVLETESGLFGTSVIYILDADEHPQYLRVPKGDVVRHEGKPYLDVAVIEVDSRGGRALVEWPSEADSGARRVWVPLPRFRRQGESGQ